MAGLYEVGEELEEERELEKGLDGWRWGWVVERQVEAGSWWLGRESCPQKSPIWSGTVPNKRTQ